MATVGGIKRGAAAGGGEDAAGRFRGGGTSDATGCGVVAAVGERQVGDARGDRDGGGAGIGTGRRRRRLLEPEAAADGGSGGEKTTAGGCAGAKVDLRIDERTFASTEGDASGTSTRTPNRAGSACLAPPLVRPLARDRWPPLPAAAVARGRTPSDVPLGPRSSVPDSLVLEAGFPTGGRFSAIVGGGNRVGVGNAGAGSVIVERASTGVGADTGTEAGASDGAGADVASPAAAAAARQRSSMAVGNRRGGGVGRKGAFMGAVAAAADGPMFDDGVGGSVKPPQTARGEKRSRPGSISTRAPVAATKESTRSSATTRQNTRISPDAYNSGHAVAGGRVGARSDREGVK